MNKRIFELAKQATQEFSPAFERDKWQEKFAELIVRECVNICMKNQFTGANYYNNGSVSSAEFIKEHFGVEE
jgi:hypothetical protein